MKNFNKIIIVVLIAVAFISGCNEPSDPDMQVMAVGSWNLVDLLMDDQDMDVDYYNTDFRLDLNDDGTCAFINYDGIGFSGTWDMDKEGTTLTLTPTSTDYSEITFDVVYLRTSQMGIERTITSSLIGTRVYTYFLEK